MADHASNNFSKFKQEREREREGGGWRKEKLQNELNVQVFYVCSLKQNR